MKITKITKNKNGKYKIYFDNKETLITYDDVILNNGILFKKELTNEEINNINIECNYYDVYNKTIKFISSRMRSEKEIIDFLNKKSIIEKDKKRIISKLKEIHLIDDERFAKAYFIDRINLSADGPYKIKQDLIKNDINEEIIEIIFQGIDIEIIFNKLDKLIQKKIKSNHNKSKYILKQKIITDMINLGYDKDMILEILEKRLVSNTSIINNEYQKIKNKLSRKYNDYELEKQIKIKLQQKGFTLDEINHIEKED